jgi:alpha-galactosidase
MGWNSWNQFHCDDLTQDLVHETAQALIDLGLADLGYQYVNLDDCWQISRNESGYIQEDMVKFPLGIASLSDHVHSLGLYFGLYSDAGLRTCQGRPGGLGYEEKDATVYAQWKIDYLKYDNCFSMGLDVHKRYQRMHDALNATHHPIYFSMCEWGVEDPATWAAPVGNSWRTTQDIEPTWESMTRIADINNEWWDYAGPGGWNDPDMLEVGNGDWSLLEQKTHFTLWCLMKAPLLLGNDLRNLPPEVLDIISNTELIAWNQDPLGKQGYRRSRQVLGNSAETDGLEVWAGELIDGNIALVLVNRSEKEHTITAKWSDDLGIDDSQEMLARDVWQHKDLGVFQQRFTALLRSHDAVAIQLSPYTETTLLAS